MDPESPADYLQGSCHVFAVALQRAYGYSLLALIDRAEDYGGIPAVHHVYAVDSDGNAFDFNGKHDSAAVEESWLFLDGESGSEPDVEYIADEAELAAYVSDGWDRPLDAYSDADVEAALATAKVRLSAHLPADCAVPGL